MAVLFGTFQFLFTFVDCCQSISWVQTTLLPVYICKIYWVRCYARKVAISWVDLPTSFIKSLHFLTERKSFQSDDGDNMFVRQACINTQTSTAVEPRRLSLERNPPWKPEDFNVLNSPFKYSVTAKNNFFFQNKKKWKAGLSFPSSLLESCTERYRLDFVRKFNIQQLSYIG